MNLSVEIRHVFSSFHVDVKFDAPMGVTAVVGPSGSGKSTIVNAVGGLLRPDTGRISLGGRVILDTSAGIDIPPYRRRVGYVFQDARLFPHLSVRNNLVFGQRFAPRSSRIATLDDVTDLLGIAPLLDRRTVALSGGEKQRVAIGRALLAGPEILLLDEPLASLDEARKAEVLPYLERLSAEAEIPILYVSHSRDEVHRLAQTVVEIAAGRVIRQGPVAEFTGPGDSGWIVLSVPGAFLGRPQHPSHWRVSFSASDALLAVPGGQSTAAYDLPAIIQNVDLDNQRALVTVAVGHDHVRISMRADALARTGLGVGDAASLLLTSAEVAKTPDQAASARTVSS